MDPPTTFKEKIQKLQAATEEGQRKLDSKERSIPTNVIIGALIPVVIFLILYFVQPRFVQKKEGANTVRDTRKMFYWTIGLTLIAWVGLYFWNRCKTV